MTTKRFKFLEHTGDALVEAYGRNLEEAFENAALAMFEVMTDTSKVDPKVMQEIAVEADDGKGLLYAWLEQLLVKFDVEDLLLSKFEIRRFDKTPEGYRLKAKVWGESLDPEKHLQKTGIKACTYHLMKVDAGEKGATVRFLLDL